MAYFMAGFLLRPPSGRGKRHVPILIRILFLFATHTHTHTAEMRKICRRSRAKNREERIRKNLINKTN